MGNSSYRRASSHTIGDVSDTTRCSTRRTTSLDVESTMNTVVPVQIRRSRFNTAICAPKGARPVKVHKRDLRRLLDDYCTRSYGSHSTMTSVDHYYKEIFQYQRRIDSLALVRTLGLSATQGKALDEVQQQLVEQLRMKKAQALDTALERAQNCQVGIVAQGSGMLHLCPKNDKSAWQRSLQRTLDEEYDHASEEALHFLRSYVAADEDMVKKLDETLSRQEVFWENELETLFGVWQEATSSLLDQTFSNNEVFEELDKQARFLADMIGRIAPEKSDDRRTTWMQKPTLSRNHNLLSNVTGRLLQLELWQYAHGLTHTPRTELLQALIRNVRDKMLLGKQLFSMPFVEELSKVSHMSGKLWRLEDSIHVTVIAESAHAYFESLILTNCSPPPVVDLFPNLLRMSRHGLLTACAKVGNQFWVQELFRASADALEKTAEGTPAQVAQNAGHRAIVTEIQNHLIQVESANEKLLQACFKCDVCEVESQLRGRATVNCTNRDNWTPLHIASYVGSDVLVGVLLRESCDANVSDKQGWTPLHICVENKRRDIVTLLLDAKARVDQQDLHGQSPVDLARKTNDQCLIDRMLANDRRESASSILSSISALLWK